MSDYDLDERPRGWHWGGGSAGGRDEDGNPQGYYTYWLYSNLRFHYQGEIYWDAGGDHHVCFYEETGRRSDGDVKVDDIPCASMSFDTEQEAIEWAIEKAEELIEY